jgi:hypothetical protein
MSAATPSTDAELIRRVTQLARLISHLAGAPPVAEAALARWETENPQPAAAADRDERRWWELTQRLHSHLVAQSASGRVRAALVQRVRQVLTDLQHLHEVQAIQLKPIITGSAPQSSAPRGAASAYHQYRGGLEFWVERAEKAVRAAAPATEPGSPERTSLVATWCGLIDWCIEAEIAVERTKRGRRRRPESKDEFRKRILDTYEGVHYADAARREGLSPTYIRLIRTEAWREPWFGVAEAKAAEA